MRKLFIIAALVLFGCAFRREKIMVPGCGPVKPPPDCDISKSYQDPQVFPDKVIYHCLKDEFCYVPGNPNQKVCTVRRVEVYHCIHIKLGE